MALLAFGVLILALIFVTYWLASHTWAPKPRREAEQAKAWENTSGDLVDELRRDKKADQALLGTATGRTTSTSTAGDNSISSPSISDRMVTSRQVRRSSADETEQTTPKASATVPVLGGGDIPALSLSSSSSGAQKSPTRPRPNGNVAKASSGRQSSPASSLMPPPSMKPSALRPLPKMGGPSGSSLAPPPSAASALRVPNGRPAAPNSLAADARNPTAPSTSTLPPKARASRKVVLPPGHSPLDWAHLTRHPPSPSFLRGEGVPARVLKVSTAQLGYYNGRRGRDAWGTWQGKVYNLTPYKDFHPGGVGELMRGAGKAGEAERLFNEIHPWVNWEGMLGECLVGVLVAEGEGEGEQGASNGTTSMDEMD